MERTELCQESQTARWDPGQRGLQGTLSLPHSFFHPLGTSWLPETGHHPHHHLQFSKDLKRQGRWRNSHFRSLTFPIPLCLEVPPALYALGGEG